MSWWVTQGLKTWVWQRLSAIYLALYLGGSLIVLLCAVPLDYARWHAWFAHPAVGVATAGCVVALIIHAWVGVRDVVFDYVKPYGYRLLLLGLVIMVLLAMLLWALRILILAGL